MQNFVFHNPTKVLFGRNTIPCVGKETIIFGRRVMVIHGCSSAQKNGTLDAVLSSLHEAGAETLTFGGIQPNPTVDCARLGIDQARSFQAEVICAVGGGSVIDTAKAISSGMPAPHDVWKFFTGKKSVKTALPVIAVSTIAASGSEMNSGMVLTNSDTCQKFGFGNRLLFPRVAILDPETTFTVSPAYTAYGAVDALAHLFEFYMTNTEPLTMVQDHYMEGLIQSIMESCDMAYAEPNNYQARAALMWSAGLALNGLASAGLGKVGFPMHLIEHTLSAHYNIAHGAGLGVVIPGWLRCHSDVIAERMRNLFSRIRIGTFAHSDDIAENIESFTGWLKHKKVPTTLEDLNIPLTEIPRLAASALPQAKIWRMREYSAEKIETVLQCCTRSLR